jgi:hypothetical protein
MESGDGGAVGRDGLFETYRVRSGLAYQGWFLVASVTPRPQGAAQIEIAFILLDAGGGSERPVPSRVVVGIDPVSLWRELVDAQVTTTLATLHDMLGRRARDSGMPEPEKPEAEKVAAEELLRLFIGTLSKPDDDPFRLRWLEGLAQLRNETGCRRSARTWTRSCRRRSVSSGFEPRVAARFESPADLLRRVDERHRGRQRAIRVVAGASHRRRPGAALWGD